MCMYSSHYISKCLSSQWTGTTPAPGTNKITTHVYCLFLLQNIFVCGSHLAFYIFERKTLRTCGLWRSFPSFLLLELCSLFLQFSTRSSLLLFYLTFCLYVLHLRFPTMDTLYGLIVWQYNNALVSFFSMTDKSLLSGTSVVREKVLNVGSMSVSWWIIALVISVILFLVNLTVAICLYQKNKRRILQQSGRPTKVHPALASF